MKDKPKNKSAVHLGKLSAKSRKTKFGGVKGFRAEMARIRRIQEDKKLSTKTFSKTLASDERS